MTVRNFILCLVLPAALAACGSSDPAQPGAAGPAANVGANPDITADGRLVVTVGEGGVTVDQYVERAIRSPAASSGTLSPEAQQEVMERLVTEEALWQEAVAHGLYRDAKVRKIMVNLLLREKIYANVSASDFSPDQLQAYFEEHKSEFVVPEKVQVKRIFLRVTPDRDKDASMALAAQLRQQLVQQPDRFKELAVEHSNGPYKRRGGDLGYLSSEGKPGIDKAVVDEAFKLEIGQISQPFEAAGGVNLVTVASKRERVERTFEQMKGSVLRKLKNERYTELTDSYVDEIKEKFQVQVHEDVLAGIDLTEARKSRMGSKAPEDPMEFEGGHDDHGGAH